MKARQHYVYILASRTKRLYVGVTNDIERRVTQHRTGEIEGFAQRYNIHRLVHYEELDGPADAIAREKQIKAWRREKKVSLIESTDPEWDDLADHW